MPRYLRMVRRARWYRPDWTDGNTIDWQADALGDLSTGQNALSVYLADSDEMVNHAVAALAANRKNLANLDYAIIDGDLLTRMNLQAVQNPGKTLHQLANGLHHDITNLTAANIFVLMQSITATSVTRVPHKHVKVLLERAINDGHIEKDKLRKCLTKALV